MSPRFRLRHACLLLSASCAWACSDSPSSPMSGSPMTAQPGGATAPAAGTSGTSGTGASAGTGSGATTGGRGVPSGTPAGRGGAPAGAGTAAAVGGQPAAGSGSAGTAANAGSGGSVAAAGGAAPEAGTGASTPVMCPTDALEPGDSNHSVMVDGMERTFIIHVPRSYKSEPTPLVVDFHPLSQTASFQRGNSGYNQLSEQENFIVVWPQGIQNVWNVGPCCTQSRDIDDVGFARMIVQYVSSKVCVDPKRVYADGYSMGGGMSHYLGCHAADVFATVVPSAFDLLEENSPDCKPARPITVMSFRGTSDPIVPYTGGPSSPPVAYPIDMIHFLGAVGTFERWAELNGCTGEPADTGSNCQTYQQCMAGVEVTLCTATGGSHTTGDAKQGWAMMKKHPMP